MYNSYHPGWHYPPGQTGNGWQNGYPGQTNNRAHGQGSGDTANGGAQGHPSTYQAISQGQGTPQGYTYPPYPAPGSYGASSDMQYIFQVLVNLGNQLDQLSRLIAQNNQLLQSMHGAEDTKCVQGAGGGAIIVRM
ncbi:hypothetical protein [Fictibacillus gelatini]|uniref:hypothetical protein n=1 Tax=Fictibacillus gelatini TaxID=225985 RepID=UPI00040F4E24|nr:hypothetical protein [Fictibacillus gelatini]